MNTHRKLNLQVNNYCFVIYYELKFEFKFRLCCYENYESQME